MILHPRRGGAALALVSVLVAAPGAAQPDRPEEPTLRVTATGEVRAQPDQAVVDFAVETIAATAQQAAAENAGRMQRVIAALVRAGAPRDRIETRDYMVLPEYEPRESLPGETPRIRGYRVTNTVSATLAQVEGVGPVIDAGLAAGANRIHGVRFGLSDPQRYRAQALANAVQRARADAEALAAALGVRLGPLRDVATLDFQQPVPMLREMVMAGDAAMANTPIQPGEQVVRATVMVHYGVTP